MKLSLNRSQASEAAWTRPGTWDTLQRIATVLGPPDAGVDVILTDDAFIRKINRDYRGSDRATDVISFSYLEDAGTELLADPSRSRDNLAGEIYISCETLQEEAKAQGIEFENLFLRIGVHGLLHVLGYDHGTDSEAEIMEGEERKILLAHLAPEKVEELF
ncbi:MAG: rRNA maturation RNase YbeY [Candidatus Krumholzibacteria bacterium]